MMAPISRIVKMIKRLMYSLLERFFLKDPSSDRRVEIGVVSVLIFSSSNMWSYLVALIDNKPYAPVS